MNDSLLNEKKKNDKKRQQYKNNEEKLLNEVKKLKNTISELQEENENLKINKTDDVSEM